MALHPLSILFFYREIIKNYLKKKRSVHIREEEESLGRATVGEEVAYRGYGARTQAIKAPGSSDHEEEGHRSAYGDQEQGEEGHREGDEGGGVMRRPKPCPLIWCVLRTSLGVFFISVLKSLLSIHVD